MKIRGFASSVAVSTEEIVQHGSENSRSRMITYFTDSTYRAYHARRFASAGGFSANRLAAS
jgi:hypothetical protein